MKKKIFSLITILLFPLFVFSFFEIILRISTNESTSWEYYNSFGKTNFSKINGKYCSWSRTLYPLPHYGFVHGKNTRCGYDFVNSNGVAGREFPKKKNPDYFDILITGGSVAFNMTRKNYISSKNSVLKQRLEQSFTSKDGREIRVFSGAIGSWKQPNQLFFYQINGDVFDAVLSIEGANEFSTGINLKFETPMELASNFLNFPDVDMNFEKFTLKLLSKTNSFLLLRLRVFLEKIYSDRYYKKLESSEYYRLLSRKGAHEEELVQKTYKKYLKYLKTFKTLTLENDQKFEVFFHPVVDMKFPLTGKEKKLITKNKNYTVVYKDFVEKYLPAQNKFENYFSLLGAFQHNDKEVFEDYVHYSYKKNGYNLGHDILTNNIVSVLQKKWGILPKEEN